MFVTENIREKLFKLHNAIFNGSTSAQVIEIDLDRTEYKDRSINLNNYIKRYMINLDTNSATISKGEELNLDKDSIHIAFPKFKVLLEDDETLEHKINFISLKLDDMVSPIFGNSNPRSTTFGLSEETNEDSTLYHISLFSAINLPMSTEQLHQYNAKSGLITRKFTQSINVNYDIEAVVMILPRTSSIPLIFTFKDKQNIDFNNLFENEASYIDTSFDKGFEFSDSIQLYTSPINIKSDKDFIKIKAVEKSMPVSKVDRYIDSDRGKNIYRYEDDIIIGTFESNSSDEVEYFLKGKENNYLYYSNKENYNICPFKFFDIVKEYVNHGEGLNDGEYREKAKELLQMIFNDSYLYNRLNIYPISNMHIFKEIGSNYNTYHYYIKDEMNGLEMVFTIYNGDYILLREYPIKTPSPVCYLTLMKKGDNVYSQIITSRVTLTDDNARISYYWESAINSNYTSSGLVKQNKNDIEDLVNFEIVKEIAYTSPELENFVYQQFVENTELKDSIRKFDSVLYNYENLDDVIIRNYLGLPVNFRYINSI